MIRKEPYATEKEIKERVIHYNDIPLLELAPGSKTHLIAGEQAVLSILTMSANSYFPIHQHEAEQIMIVLEGHLEHIIDGKIYHVGKGDVVILPSNIPHGAYIADVDCRFIDIFAPPRQDLVTKAKEVAINR